VSFEQLALDVEQAPPEPATCDHCGEPFTPSDPRQRLCSRSCNRAASAQRIRDRDNELRLVAGTQGSHPCRCIPRALVFRDGAEPTCVLCGRRAVVAAIRALREHHKRPGW
jgi:hypothetical protein